MVHYRHQVVWSGSGLVYLTPSRGSAPLQFQTPGPPLVEGLSMLGSEVGVDEVSPTFLVEILLREFLKFTETLTFKYKYTVRLSCNDGNFLFSLDRNISRKSRTLAFHIVAYIRMFI